MTGPVSYCHVRDVAANSALAAIVEDPSGNVRGFLQS
jgi:hypothetical protein